MYYASYTITQGDLGIQPRSRVVHHKSTTMHPCVCVFFIARGWLYPPECDKNMQRIGCRVVDLL